MEIIPTTYFQDTDNYYKLLEGYCHLGVDTLRINCTRANINEYLQDINKLKYKFYEINRINVRILLDIPIPKTKPRIMFDRPIKKERIAFSNGGDTDYYLIKKGEVLTLSSGLYNKSELLFKISSNKIFDSLEVGDELIVGENSLVIRLVEKHEEKCDFVAVCDGYISYGKYLYSKKVKTVLEEDYLKFMPLVKNIQPDYVALSFVESEKDIQCFKSKYNIDNSTKIISKIETKKGIENLSEIAMFSDALMIARGDLYNHTDFVEFCYANEKILRIKNRPIFAATGFLETISSCQDKPLRSEIIDLFFYMKRAQGIVLSYQQSQDKDVFERCVSIINQLEVNI